MSNYATTYNINQTGDLYAIDASGSKAGLGNYASSTGTTINSPVNYRFLKLFTGLDNEFIFYIKNTDRKPIQLHGQTITANVVNRETQVKLLSKKCQIVDYDEGKVKLVITSGEMVAIQNGFLDLVFTYINSQGLNLPLFVDQNLRPNYTIEVSNQTQSIPLLSASTETFILRDGFYYSSHLPGPGAKNKVNGMVTLAVYATNYTGNFFIQGSLEENPEENDWFNIILGTYTDEHYPYIDQSGIDPWTFRTNIKYLRAKFTQTKGTLDKVIIRV
jgi:hypothetical protein